MDRSQMIGGLAAATGGCAALLSLTTARQFVGRDASLGDVVVHAPETAAAVGIIVAILVAALTSGRGVAASAVAAVGLVGVAVTVNSSTQSWTAAWITAALAGLAVGGLVTWASDRAVVPALAAGAVVGATFAFPLRHPLVLAVRGPSPGYTVDTRSVGITLVVIALVCLVIATRRVVSAPAPSARSAANRRAAAVCLGITTVAWALGIWFESAQPTKGWYWGWLLVLAVTGGAFVLRTRCGAVLIVALAWAVIHSVDLSWLPEMVWLLVLVPLAVVGIVVGRRLARPEILLLPLIPTAATWLITDSIMSRTFSVLALCAAPVLIVAAFTSEVRRRPMSPAVLATALTAVALWETSPRAVVFVIAISGSESFTADIGQYFVPRSITLAAEYAVPAVLALAVCAVALWLLRRRAHDA